MSVREHWSGYREKIFQPTGLAPIVNLNIWSTFTDGSNSVTADTNSDTFTFVGTGGITTTIDSGNKRLIIDGGTNTIKYAETVTLGSGIGAVTVTHNLGTTDVVGQAWTTIGSPAVSDELVDIDISVISTNSVSVQAFGGVQDYRIVVLG